MYVDDSDNGYQLPEVDNIADLDQHFNAKSTPMQY